MMGRLDLIKQAVEQEQLAYSQLTLARYLAELYPQANDQELGLAVLVNEEINAGNVCLHRDEIVNRSQACGLDSLQREAWIDVIHSSQLVGDENQNRALVYQFDRLYLNRFHYHESRLAEHLLRLAQGVLDPGPADLAKLQRLFPGSHETNDQKLAALISLRKKLCIVSGGPGTGKTWTVGRLIALMLAQNRELKIRLAAPTGKAATRLAQSIQAVVETLPKDLADRSAIPAQAGTLHRLLGMHRFTHRPRYDAENPLDCDVLVIDEASMIDQQMMAQVCAALPRQGRLVLLGDRDQLSSVEAGSVFADLCGDTSQSRFSVGQAAWVKQQAGISVAVDNGDQQLADCRVVLRHSRRFDARSGIGQLARLINTGDADAAVELLTSQVLEDVEWWQYGEKELHKALVATAANRYLEVARADSVQTAFTVLARFQVLAAVWNGPAGVNEINRVVEQHVLRESGILIDTPFYRGKPLMINRNIPDYGLYNGDVGLIWPDDEGQLKLWFRVEGLGLRALSLSQLTDHTTAYAMTVHKSQGSEFDQVLLILPSQISPVCSRELVYTAITRAMSKVEIWAGVEVLRSAIATRTQRMSGLVQRLNT